MLSISCKAGSYPDVGVILSNPTSCASGLNSESIVVTDAVLTKPVQISANDAPYYLTYNREATLSPSSSVQTGGVK